MQTSTKVKSLTIVSVICVAVIIGLGLFTLKLSNDLARLESKLPDPSTLAKKQKPLAFPRISKKSPASPMDPWQHSPSPDPGIQKLYETMQNHIDNTMNSSPFNFPEMDDFQISSLKPDIKFEETHSEYKITIAIPEGKNVEINTKIVDNVLSISGKIRSEKKSTDNNITAYTRSFNQFSQMLPFAKPVDQEKMVTEKQGKNIIITVPKKQKGVI